MKVRGAHHTSYTVSNLERSLVLYRDLLGCEEIWRREIADQYFRDIVAFPDCVVKAALLRIPDPTTSSSYSSTPIPWARPWT